mgnify:CR=1 FL=1
MSDNNATVRVHFLPDDNSLAKLQKALAKAMDVSKIGKGLQIKADQGSLNKLTTDVKKALTKAVGKPLTPIIKPKIEASATNQIQNAMAGLSRAMSGMGAIAMGQSLGGGIVNFIKDLATAGFEIEKTQLSLENLFGSAEMGKGVMQDLMQLATKMPGSVLDLLPAYRQLVLLGLSPSKDEMYALGEISTLTGKKITDTAMAIQMAGGGTYKRLRSMGIEVKKNGDQLTMTYLGVSKTIGTSKKAIYDYMVELGKMPGVQGAMAKQMDTLAGQTQNTADQFAILKYELYILLEKAFLPLVKWISLVVQKMAEWVAEHPKLAQALLVITIVIGLLIAGLLLTLGFVILVSMAMSAWTVVTKALTAATVALDAALLPLIWEIVLIGLVILAVIVILVLLYVYWDEICLWMQLAWYGVVEAFWNGIYGIGIAFLEFLNWVYDNFGPFAEFFMEVALFILSAFTMNIPGIAHTFALMADGAATAIMALEKFSLQVASSIAGGFAKAFNYIANEGKKLKSSADKMGIGWMVDGIAILSGASSLAYFNGNDAGKVAQQASTNWSSQANAVQKQIDSKTAEQKARNNSTIDKFKQDRDAKTTELKNMSQGAKDSYDRKKEVKEAKKDKAQEDFMSQVKDRMAEITGAKEMLDENGNPIDEGADKGGGGKDKGGGSKKVGDGKDTAIDKASITAISGIQKVLRDMGYSLESEIRRADLFKAQREALKAIEAERQRKNLSPIISLYNTITNRPEKSSGSTQNVNININAHGVNKDTKLKDLLKMADKR